MKTLSVFVLFAAALCFGSTIPATTHISVLIHGSAGTPTNTTDALRLVDSSNTPGDISCFGLQSLEGADALRGKVCGGLSTSGTSGKLTFSTRTTSGTMLLGLQINDHQNVHMYDSIIVDSLAAFSKNLTIAGAMSVSGTATMAAINQSGDYNIASGKFTVASASGNTVVAGTLGVTGLATVGGTLGVTGLSTLTGVIGIGVAPSTDIACQLNYTMVSAATDQYGYFGRVVASSSATNSGNGIYLQVRSAAASYHMKMGYGAEIGNAVAGATSTIDTLVGVHIEAQTVGATKNYAIETLGGKNFFGDTVVVAGKTAVTAGGATVGIVFGSSGGPQILFGSGAPTISAPKGSLYLRTDGTSTSTRMYVNTDAGTTWTNVTTGA